MLRVVRGPSPGCSAPGMSPAEQPLMALGSVVFSGSQAGQHAEEGHFSEDGVFRAGKVSVPVAPQWFALSSLGQVSHILGLASPVLPQCPPAVVCALSADAVPWVWGVWHGGCRSRRAMEVLCMH